MRQDAIPQVEPQGAGLVRANRYRQVDHVAGRPDRILDADVQRNKAARIGRQLHRGQIDRDAVQPVVAVLPAIIPRSRDRLVRCGIAEARRDQDMHDRRCACRPLDDVSPAGRPGADRGLDARGRHGEHGRPLVGRIAPRDKGVERFQRRERRRGIGTDGIVELERTGRLHAGRDVIGPDFLDRLFGHPIGEPQRAAGALGRPGHAAHHAL